MRLPDPGFWRGRRVFLSGHTGFKGSWLAFWLHRLGAEVTGYALPPQTDPSAFELLRVAERTSSQLGDVRDVEALAMALRRSRAGVVFHLAAQPLVLRGYREPVLTFETNVMGSVNLLEAVRSSSETRAVVVVTTDKVYAESDDGRAYRESDALGGPDPYSASKACAELVTSAYRDAFLRERGVAVASVRAGNVIGGGDWSADRLIPDLVAALRSGNVLRLRNAGATRPWQHVLDPLAAYLVLAERLIDGDDVARAWNIGPDAASVATVGDVVARFEAAWGRTTSRQSDVGTFHEAPRLQLDASAARAALGWAPRLALDDAIGYTAEWFRGHAQGDSAEALTIEQINRYVATAPLGAPIAAGPQ
jgi:CDP-glucose 4,6-dehydratase